MAQGVVAGVHEHGDEAMPACLILDDESTAISHPGLPTLGISVSLFGMGAAKGARQLSSRARSRNRFSGSNSSSLTQRNIGTKDYQTICPVSSDLPLTASTRAHNPQPP